VALGIRNKLASAVRSLGYRCVCAMWSPCAAGDAVLRKPCVCVRQGVKCEVMSADSYYMSPPEGVNPADHNFDEPAALELGLLAKHLRSLKVGLPCVCCACWVCVHACPCAVWL